MSNNVYGSGRKNVGSYQVSGKPYVTASTVSIGEELKVEFPNITNNISVKYKNPRSSALNFIARAAMSASVTVPDGGAYTIMMRIQGDEATGTGDSSNNYILSTWEAGSNVQGARALFKYSNEKLTFQAQNVDGSDIVNGSFDFQLDANDWAYRTFTVSTDGSTSYIVHLDNTNVFTKGASDVDSVKSFDAIQLSDDSANNFRRGKYTEVAFFRTGMTVDEINQLHNSGSLYNIKAHPKAGFLEHLWTFGDDPRDELNKIHDTIGTAHFGPAYAYSDGDTAFATRNYSSTLTGSLRAHFRSTGTLPNVANNRHYWNFESTNEELDMNVMTKEIYLSADGGDCEFSLEADLTNIPTSSMYQHTGSGVDE
jgi:hypothetical protein